MGAEIASKRHAKTEMQYVQKVPFKSKPTHRFRSGFNVWKSVHKCPACGAHRAPLSNLIGRGSERKRFFCTGTERSNY